MPEQTFEVGDQIYFPQTKHFGIIVAVRIRRPFRQTDGEGVRSYNIKLDDGATLMDISRGIERVPGK